MKIAIVDDFEKDRQDIIQYLIKYQKHKQLQFDILEYDNGEDLLDNLKKTDIQIVFLDIYMPISGIDIAKEIRKWKYDCAIIFITTSTEHYPESYDIFSHHYIVKPVDYHHIVTALERCQNYLTEANRYIQTSTHQKIYLHDIQYIEVIHNTTILHAQKEYKLNLPLSKLLESINDYHIARIHKSFAVSFQYIKYLKGYHLELLDGTILNVGRTYFKEFKDSYIAYLTNKEED